LPLQRDERYVFEQMMMDCAMHTNMNLQTNLAKKPEPKAAAYLWFLGVAVRTIFLVILTVLTARVAAPQVETIRTVLETPGDLIRVGLGFTVCLWLIANIFILPKDAGAYRTWTYLGPALLPLSLLCAIVVW
jgi:hypothetical protein